MTGCGHDINPRVDFLYKNATPAFVVAWIIGGALAILSVICTRIHYTHLRSTPGTLRRDLYEDIVLLGPVFCVSGYISLTVPRMQHLCDTVQAFYEARVLYDFGRLIINYREFQKTFLFFPLFFSFFSFLFKKKFQPFNYFFVNHKCALISLITAKLEQCGLIWNNSNFLGILVNFFPLFSLAGFVSFWLS
jgi:hypothetical protein